MRSLVAIAALLAASMAASADEFRITSWNIANLHHDAGAQVRPGIGTRRSENDFDLLRKYGAELGRDRQPADIIALQEIGTLEGAQRIFPADQYQIFISDRYNRDIAEGPSEDIYTAIAIRKDRGISVLKQADVEELSIFHPNDDPSHVTRSGTALLLDIDGQPLWVLSVHLKSSCSHIRSADTSTRDDCETFWRQREPLFEWIEARNDEAVPFVIAGDFNRRFRQFQDEGPFWRAINGGDLDDPLLSKHPETVTRKCPTRKGSSTQPIDWILLDSSVAHWFVEGSFWETRFSSDDVDDAGGYSSQRLSDHCPISIDISF